MQNVLFKHMGTEVRIKKPLSEIFDGDLVPERVAGGFES
jgi:hypothetical protein